ncbi:ATP-binding cassette domain-containing protein [Rothia sp. ZJ932]|nr:ATP-binding cassette domain-containing protein [Rothia sp. ZJ1223]MBM7050631.1 ATP-binding cassette domain-containing protein [Rothia sp. ZJ1223]QRZ62598.1 ATP-binding cassette domain-containing protein [Rothia sp. ZJ932]
MIQGRSEFTALAPTSLVVAPGESLAVTGRSGAGKSTLANVILGLVKPDSGTVSVQGSLWADTSTSPERRRRHLVQSVPQDAQASFVPRWTIRRSLEHAAQRLRPDADAQALISQAVEQANFDASLLERRPHQISGGQAQRAAIARALVPEPVLIVADEPTSALDTTTSHTVIDSILRLTHDAQTSLLVVTHDPYFASRCDHLLTLTSAHQHA